jgi:hypothetical protein
MLLRLFKGTGPGVIFLIMITLISIWMSAFLNPPSDSVFQFETESMPLYKILEFVFGKNHFFGVVFSFLMVSLISFLLVNFNTNVFFINERTFLPALIYILYSGLFHDSQILNPVLPASLFLILALIRIIDSYRKPDIAYNFFDAGILISTGSLFYANLIWFGLILFIGIAILRTVNIQEITISILGIFTPYLVTFGFYYVTGKDLASLRSLVEYNLFSKSVDYPFSKLTIVVLILTGMLLFIGIANLIMVMSSKKIKSRKTFSMLIWIFLISGGIYFLLHSASVEIIWLAGIPVSYFLAHYFVFVRKRLVPEVFFSVLFILILVIQIFSLK